MSHAGSRKFQKSDRHSNRIEVENAFYHFEWKGWRNATPWMTAWLTWLSAVYTGALGYHTPKANNSRYLSKQANVPRNALMSNSERWEGIQKKSYSLFYCLLRDALMHTPSALTPTTRRWAEAHGKPWAAKPKPESRNHGIFTRRYQAWLPGFPVYVGASKQPCNSHVNGKVSRSWPITTTNPIKIYTVPDTITDCSIKSYSVRNLLKVCP